MNKKHKSIYDNQNKYPDWYWINGLHDACIIGSEVYEFPFDYNSYSGEKRSRDRNMFMMRLDSSGALFDINVKEIRLFNYKILSKEELKGRKKVWWFSDRLDEKDGHYILEIDLKDFDSWPNEFTFKIQFDRAEVDR